MKTVFNREVLFSFLFLMTALSCAETAKSGEEGVDCGDNGSAHGEHCHCNSGYFYNGETCVAPDEITEECAEEAEEEADGGDHDADSDHDHEGEHEPSACICPVEGECHCDGDITEHGGREYCSPDLHADH